MLVKRGVRTPTEVVKHLHTRGVEVMTFEKPSELFAESALLHVVERLGERGPSSSPSKQKPLLVLIVEPDNDPEISALTDALRKYFPTLVMWSYQQDSKPQLCRMIEKNSQGSHENAQVHADRKSRVPSERAVPVNPKEPSIHDESASGNDHEEGDEETPCVIRFEDIVRASQDRSGQSVTRSESHQPFVERALHEDEEHDEVRDPMFDPPRFSTLDEFENEEVAGAGDRFVHDDIEEAQAPGFVTDEELTMLLDDSDFLFSDAEEASP